MQLIVTSTVPTPGHRAPERHPATVLVNTDAPCKGHRRPRVYAHFVPAPENNPHDYPAPRPVQS